MCFSAEVSFGAAAVISTVGVVAYKKASPNSFRVIAMIPILFGIHQFLEGLVWVFIESNATELLAFSKYSYLFFAWVIWPFYIPYANWKVEKIAIRKKILFGFMVIGLLLGVILLSTFFIFDITATVVDHSILYEVPYQNDYLWIIHSLYFAAVVLPNAISSTPKMWILAALNIVLFTMGKVLLDGNVISVWCFFAAITSLFILYIIVYNRKLYLKAGLNHTA
ncbi:hypothetical protein DNU06_05945 [Putridiphycobacter roseus]|uniref:Uncharacterized protein n=1 Tax=Putridiphycobacter roseus TaxID=2219161 RepID=A0A2W1NJM2_9FLAO|nr:DUF6629 family protein [Putridiphycobacter roseus]PZE18156.1 hypothetical protein DNU06_05945 [Putridiphycobacter roseus]